MKILTPQHLTQHVSRIQTTKVENIPVKCGGYRIEPTELAVGSDTAIPAGTYWIKTPITGGIQGYSFDPQPDRRTAIELHEKAREHGTSGCIAFRDEEGDNGQWDAFVKAVTAGNDKKGNCPHNNKPEHHNKPLNKIKLVVSYADGLPAPNNVFDPP